MTGLKTALKSPGSPMGSAEQGGLHRRGTMHAAAAPGEPGRRRQWRGSISLRKAGNPAAWSCGVFLNAWVREQDLNLRPSGYEPDELPGCSIPRQGGVRRKNGSRSYVSGRPRGDLLSRALRRSTIGSGGLNDRVRNGIGCGTSDIATGSTRHTRRRRHRRVLLSASRTE